MARQRRERGEGAILFEEDRRRWVGILDLGLGSERRRRPKVVGTSRQAVREKLEALRDAHRLGLDVGSRTITFDDLATLWLERDLGPEVSGNTRANYRTLLRGRIRGAVGHRRVTTAEP